MEISKKKKNKDTKINEILTFEQKVSTTYTETETQN